MTVLLLVLITIVACAFAVSAVILRAGQSKARVIEQVAEAAAIAAQEKTYAQILSTPAPVLVAADPDPAARRAELDRIRGGFRQRVRDRSKLIVSRNAGD